MIEFYFMRHARTEWNDKGILQGELDSSLTKAGIEETKKLYKKLNDDNIVFDYVYCSHAFRAKKTAYLLGYEKIIEMNEFNELAMGEIKGKSYEEFKYLYPKEYNNFENSAINYNPSKFNGESYKNMMERIEKGLKKLLNFHEEEILNPNIKKRVLIITHGLTLKGIICYSKNLTLESYEKEKLPENLQLINIKI